MKKAVILLVMFFVAFGVFKMYESYQVNQEEQKKKQAIENAQKSFVSNGYKSESNKYLSNNNLQNYTFYNSDKSYFEICKEDNEYDCVAYYWEKDTARIKYCRYDLAKEKVINNSYCSTEEVGKLKELKITFEKEIEKMGIELETMRLLKTK